MKSISKETFVKAGLSALPYVGGTIASFYSDYIDNKKYERLETFYNQVSVRLDSMDQKLKERLASQKHDYEMLISLIEKINNEIELEQSTVKIQAYQQTLINILLSPLENSSSFTMKSYFLDALSHLNIYDISLLKYFFNKTDGVPIKYIDVDGKNDPYLSLGIVNNLKRFGFIKTFNLTGPLIGVADNSLEDYAQLSDLGKKFTTFCIDFGSE